jgi:hypothetical protein
LTPGEAFADEKEEPHDHPEDQGHEGGEAVLQAQGEAGEIRTDLELEKISPGACIIELITYFVPGKPGSPVLCLWTNTLAYYGHRKLQQ